MTSESNEQTDDNMHDSTVSAWYRSPLAWIMAGLLAWGTYLAIGSLLAGGGMAVWRAVLIFGCTVAFLLIWLAVLSVRRKRNVDI